MCVCDTVKGLLWATRSGPSADALPGPGGARLALASADSGTCAADFGTEAAPRMGGRQAAWEPLSGEELANSLTHGVGLVLSLVGCYVLLAAAGPLGRTQTVACAVFGGSLIVLYAASTLYHSVRDRTLKRLLRVIDYACIYGLIAGTYTPVCLVAPDRLADWPLLAVVWAGACAGVGVRVVYRERTDRLSPWLYLALGWLVLFDMPRLYGTMGAEGVAWLWAGGLFYTGGVAIFMRDSQPFFHAVWHLFTLAGSACHYVAVLVYAVPGGR